MEHCFCFYLDSASYLDIWKHFLELVNTNLLKFIRSGKNRGIHGESCALPKLIKTWTICSVTLFSIAEETYPTLPAQNIIHVKPKKLGMECSQEVSTPMWNQRK